MTRSQSAAGSRQQDQGAPQVDLVIVGGGPVGASLAAALDGSGLKVLVLEARELAEAPDPRALALSEGTRLILDRLGVWAGLSAQATAIDTIHVSQRGGLGSALLTAKDAGVAHLGQVAEYGDLYAALARRLDASEATVLRGARVTSVEEEGGSVRVCYARDGVELTVNARLVVLSEGGKALPAKLRRDKDYDQSAVLATVRSERPHAGRAYERFTAQGPLALLPLGGSHDWALVWTTPKQEVDTRLSLDDAEFLRQLQLAFGDRQGRLLAAGPRSAFPLKMALAAPSASARILRIGNAAHALHPVAGQGFNLGVRDAWKLAEQLAGLPVERLGAAPIKAYEQSRRFDVIGGSLMTDLLVEVFSNANPLLHHARGAALGLLDLLPPLKRLFARKMMFGARTW